MPENNTRFAEVVGGHLDVDPVANADADEILAHLAGYVSQDFVAIWQCNPEHRPGQYQGDDSA